MPVLHSQFNAQGTDPEGKPVQIPPVLVLIQRGPILQVAITIAEQMATELIKQGKTIQPPVAGAGANRYGCIRDMRG